METLVYNPQGVCSKQFMIEHENGKIVSVKILGGCNGNLQGISKLLIGMSIEEAISRLEGIRCGSLSQCCKSAVYLA